MKKKWKNNEKWLVKIGMKDKVKKQIKEINDKNFRAEDWKHLKWFATIFK